MVKIKDFTIGFKKLGGGARAPMPYTISAHDRRYGEYERSSRTGGCAWQSRNCNSRRRRLRLCSNIGAATSVRGLRLICCLSGQRLCLYLYSAEVGLCGGVGVGAGKISRLEPSAFSSPM